MFIEPVVQSFVINTYRVLGLKNYVSPVFEGGFAAGARHSVFLIEFQGCSVQTSRGSRMQWLMAQTLQPNYPDSNSNSIVYCLYNKLLFNMCQPLL